MIYEEFVGLVELGRMKRELSTGRPVFSVKLLIFHSPRNSELKFGSGNGVEQRSGSRVSHPVNPVLEKFSDSSFRRQIFFLLQLARTAIERDQTR